MYTEFTKKRTGSQTSPFGSFNFCSENATAARLRVIDLFQKLDVVLKDRQTKMLKEIQKVTL